MLRALKLRFQCVNLRDEKQPPMNVRLQRHPDPCVLDSSCGVVTGNLSKDVKTNLERAHTDNVVAEHKTLL